MGLLPGLGNKRFHKNCFQVQTAEEKERKESTEHQRRETPM
jgi:hypothetical protein